MKFFKNLKLDVKELVLIILIPMLSLLIMIMGWISYHEMHQTILKGFDQKLMGVSSTTGSFIDGDEHEELARAKEVKAMAFGEGEKLYGIDKDNNFLSIDAGLGLAADAGSSEIIFKLDREVNDFTYNSRLKIFLATAGQEIISIDLDKEKITTYYDVGENVKGIAYNHKSNILYFTTEKGITKLDKTKELKENIKTTHFFKSLVYNDAQEVFYGLDIKTDKLYIINSNNLQETLVEYESFPPETSELKTLAFHGTKLYSGNKHLFEYDLNTSKGTFKDFARGYRNEKSPIYKKYIEPMTAIKLEAGLTYHYTQNLIYNNPDANCFYILDVHDGSEYTPMGSEDVMDTQTLIGAENVMLRNMIYVSDVQQWEQWGLLKVSFAPITNNEGIVKAIAGADVDVSIINEKTKEALIETLVIGTIFILIAILAAITISKKIIEPIQKLKYAALCIAAGRYVDKIMIESPKELSELSYTFNTMDAKLKNTVSGLLEYDSSLRTERREQNIKRILNQEYKMQHEKIRLHSSEFSNAVDGVFLDNDILYFWFAAIDHGNTLLHIKERGKIAATLENLIGKVSNPLSELQLIYKEISQLGYIDLNTGDIFIDSNSEDLSVLLVENNESYAMKTLKPGTSNVSKNIVFAQRNILEILDIEKMNYLLQAKQSQIDLADFSILFAIVHKEEL